MKRRVYCGICKPTAAALGAKAVSIPCGSILRRARLNQFPGMSRLESIFPERFAGYFRFLSRAALDWFPLHHRACGANRVILQG